MTPVDELTERRAGYLAVLRANRVPCQYIAGSEPPGAYVDWLKVMLPDVSISVMPGTGHFPIWPGPPKSPGCWRGDADTSQGSLGRGGPRSRPLCRCDSRGWQILANIWTLLARR